MEQKSRLKGFLTIGFGTIINIIISVITTPIITRIVDTKEYGQLSMFTTYSSIAVMVLCLGLDQSLIRYYYDLDSADYKSSLIRFVYKVSIAISIVLVFFSGCIFIFAKKYINIDIVTISLLIVFILIQITSRFSMIVLRVEYKSKLYAVLNIIHKAIYLVFAFCIYLVSRKEVSIIWLYIATIISSLIPTIASVIKEDELWLNNKKVNIDKRGIIRYGLPFILSMGITTLFEALDRISINYFCDYSEVGIYASAMSIIGIFAIIQTTFNTLWAPTSIEQYTKEPQNYNFFRTVNDVIVVLMFLFGITLVLFKDIIILMLGEKYRGASSILPFLVFHPIMYTISETTVVGVDFSKKSHMHVYTAIAACVVNGIGNYILVPIFGGQGAAISTGISYIAFFAFRTLFGLKNYNYKPHILRITLITVICLLFCYFESFSFPLYICIGTYFIELLLIIFMYKKTLQLIYSKGITILKSFIGRKR